MDPYLANLNFDPPRRSSELAWGLLPALLVNVAFFGIVLLGAQPGDLDPGDSSSLALTREMGGPPAPAAAPAPAPATTQPVAGVQAPAPAAAQPPAPTVVARADPQAGSPSVAKPAPAPRVSPSFDCNRARLRTDKLICSDAELSQLDHDLAPLYARAKAAAPDAAAFRRASDRAWAQREVDCRNQGKECLRRWYAERRAQLQASLEGRRQATGNPTR